MKDLETGLTYAQLNNVRNSIRRYASQPDWFSAWIYCLKHGDEEAAHIIRFRNDPDYAEKYREEAERALESAPLRSCAEVWEEELEATYAVD